MVSSPSPISSCLSALLSVSTIPDYPWLLVFDNADDLEILRCAWPANGRGSVLLTTRDPSACYSPASAGFHVEPFDDEVGSEVLLHLVGIDAQSSSNRADAKPIIKALGGLPLALNQIGGFIAQRRLRLTEFLPLYERNSARINARKQGIGGYDRTLSTVWEMSMSKLSGDSQRLLHLLPLFNPDNIHESIFLEGSACIGDLDFMFLQDMME